MRAERNGPFRRGKLPVEEYQRLVRDEPSYIVYSYETPIAWITPDGPPYIPNVDYSKTTSYHQHLVKDYLR